MSGYRTYIVGALMILLGVFRPTSEMVVGAWSPNWEELMPFLQGFGLIFLRAALSSALPKETVDKVIALLQEILDHVKKEGKKDDLNF